METQMKCPCCKSDIVKGPKERYQTLDEHVCKPNIDCIQRTTLICSDIDCITRKHNVFWDYSGDMYGGFELNDYIFFNSNNSPFGSLSRRLNVEIYKVGLKKNTYLSPKWLFNIYQPVIDYKYKSNEDGEVLKKSFELTFLKKDNKNSSSYDIVVVPFWRTIVYLFGQFKRHKKDYNNSKSDYNLKRMFKPAYNRAWIYKAFESTVKVLYFPYYLKYKKIA